MMNTYRPRLFRFAEMVTGREGSGGKNRVIELQPIWWICARFKIPILVSESYIAFFEFLGARCPNSKINTSTVVEGVFSLIIQRVLELAPG